jgi:hypothetical protein
MLAGRERRKPGGPLREVEGEVGQARAVAGGFADQQRLHQGRRLAPIFGRFYVLFNVRFMLSHISIYIMYL